MKFLIIDDHPLLAAGVREVLCAIRPGASCLQAQSAAEALRMLDAHPDLDAVCLDLNLPDADGFEVLATIKHRRGHLPVVVLSAREDVATVDRALVGGADGYLTKSASRAELAASLDDFLRHRRCLAPALELALATYRANEEAVLARHPPRLTRRQRDVLALMARGLSNQQIGTELELAESTVKGHVSCLLDLLAARNRITCVRRARTLGLLPYEC